MFSKHLNPTFNHSTGTTWTAMVIGAKRQWDWKNVSLNKEKNPVPEKKNRNLPCCPCIDQKKKRKVYLSGMSRKLST